jgi:hypothetical protein
MVMPRLLDVRIEVYVRTATSTRTDGVSDATLMPVPGNLEAAAATPRSAIPEHADGVSTREECLLHRECNRLRLDFSLDS